MFLLSLKQIEYWKKKKERHLNQVLQSPLRCPAVKLWFGSPFLWHKLEAKIWKFQNLEANIDLSVFANSIHIFLSNSIACKNTTNEIWSDLLRECILIKYLVWRSLSHSLFIFSASSSTGFSGTELLTWPSGSARFTSLTRLNDVLRCPKPLSAT